MHALWHQIPIDQVTVEEMDAVTVPRAPSMVGSPEVRQMMEG